MHIQSNAPSLLAAREIISAARHDEWTRIERLAGLGLADAVDLHTATLSHQELIEVIATLAAAIERLAASPDNVLKLIGNAIAPGAGKR
jgi:hypothetical protein